MKNNLVVNPRDTDLIFAQKFVNDYLQKLENVQYFPDHKYFSGNIGGYKISVGVDFEDKSNLTYFYVDQDYTVKYRYNAETDLFFKLIYSLLNNCADSNHVFTIDQIVEIIDLLEKAVNKLEIYAD